MRGFDLRPALIASAVLHAGVLAAGFFTWTEHEEAKPEEMVTSVPVTLVSAPPAEVPQSAPAPDPGPPEPAPAPAPPEPAPIPDPPAASPPPPPNPAPAPPKPAPPAPAKPQPTPAKPAPERPAPKPGPGPAKPQPPAPTKAPDKPAAKPGPATKPAPAAEPALDLDALSTRIARNTPRRARTPTPAPDTAGSGGTSAEELADARRTLAARLVDAWNPNCQVEGGSRINVRVRFRLSAEGRVVGEPEVVGGVSSEPLVRAAQDRAVRAILKLQPYDWMPKEALNETYAPNFNAQQACSR